MKEHLRNLLISVSYAESCLSCAYCPVLHNLNGEEFDPDVPTLIQIVRDYTEAAEDHTTLKDNFVFQSLVKGCKHPAKTEEMPCHEAYLVGVVNFIPDGQTRFKPEHDWYGRHRMSLKAAVTKDETTFNYVSQREVDRCPGYTPYPE